MQAQNTHSQNLYKTKKCENTGLYWQCWWAVECLGGVREAEASLAARPGHWWECHRPQRLR